MDFMLRGLIMIIKPINWD